MGNNHPVSKPRQAVQLLKMFGFVEARQRGSHKQFRHLDGRDTTVPFHPGQDISPILLRQICRDIGVSVEEFIAGPRTEMDIDATNDNPP